MLESESFEVLAIYFTGMPPFGGRSKSYVDHNVNRVNNSPTRKINHLGKLKHWVLGQFAFSNLAAAAIDHFKLGDTMYMVARKK